jgi:hypothetical protein
MLLRNMPEPSTPEARRARDEFEVSSRLWPYSRLRVLPQGTTGLHQSSLRSPPDRRRRPRFIPSLCHKGTRQLLSVNALSIITSPEMPVTTSTSVVGVEVMTVHPEATTCTGVGAMIARRIVAHLPSHRALESSARPSAGPSFRSSFVPQRLSPSITARPNPNFGSLISAWLVSWAGPPTTVSSFDSFPYSCQTSLERGSRTSHLERSTTGATR